MSRALLPNAIASSRHAGHPLAMVGAGLLGVVALSLLSRLTIPLPWTPVPITGQTFGVALLGLLGGRKLAVSTVAAYLALGLNGVPVFANGQAILSGATAGYLAGMLLAAALVGRLADLGWTRSFGRALAASYAGSFCIFAVGLLVLSRFVPAAQLLGAGLYPFLLGDLIKNVAAATLASNINLTAARQSA